MVRTSQPDRQQTLALEPDTAKVCPVCGSISRYFGRRGRGVWTCTARNCGQMFEQVVEPLPKPRGGKPRG
jgi:ribosomal protein L37AE/L43A